MTRPEWTALSETILPIAPLTFWAAVAVVRPGAFCGTRSGPWAALRSGIDSRENSRAMSEQAVMLLGVPVGSAA